MSLRYKYKRKVKEKTSKQTVAKKTISLIIHNANSREVLCRYEGNLIYESHKAALHAEFSLKYKDWSSQSLCDNMRLHCVVSEKLVGYKLLQVSIRYQRNSSYMTHKHTCSDSHTDEISLSALNMFARRLGTNKIPMNNEHSTDRACNFKVQLTKQAQIGSSIAKFL